MEHFYREAFEYLNPSVHERDNSWINESFPLSWNYYQFHYVTNYSNSEDYPKKCIAFTEMDSNSKRGSEMV